MNKRTFEVDGVAYEVRRPTPSQDDKADLVYGKAWREAMEAGLIVRARLDAHLRDQNLWDDRRQAEYDEVLKRLWANERKLKQGGAAGLTRGQGKEIAVEMRKDRALLFLMGRDRNGMDANTAEAHADQKKFDHLVFSCTYRDGKPAFKTLEDYHNGGELRNAAALEFGKLYYGVDDDADRKRPENEFLLKYGYVNESLQLVDPEGNLVDADGNRVDAQGRRVNADGQLVDPDGNPIDEDGNYIVESAPFLDDPVEQTV